MGDRPMAATVNKSKERVIKTAISPEHLLEALYTYKLLNRDDEIVNITFKSLTTCVDMKNNPTKAIPITITLKDKVNT